MPDRVAAGAGWTVEHSPGFGSRAHRNALAAYFVHAGRWTLENAAERADILLAGLMLNDRKRQRAANDDEP